MELQSSTVNELATALVKVQAEIRDAEKNSLNPHFKSQYANLESVIAATREPFANHGLVVAQQSSIEDGKPVLVTTLFHSSGQWIRSVMPIMNERNTAQGLGSGLSYARRYSLSAIAGITQSDDDGEAASAKGAGKLRSFGGPAMPQGERDKKVVQLRQMLQMLDETESSFLEHSSRMCKRPLKKIDDMTDPELAGAVTMLSQMIDQMNARQK